MAETNEVQPVPQISPLKAKMMLESQGFLPDKWSEIMEHIGKESETYHALQALIVIARGKELRHYGEVYEEMRKNNGFAPKKGWGQDHKEEGVKTEK